MAMAVMKEKIKIQDCINGGADVHSRKGIMATRFLSWGSPFHLGKITAFSGCAEVCSGSVSSMTTLDRSRLRYDKSYIDSQQCTTINKLTAFVNYFNNLAIYRTSCFAEKTIVNVESISVEFV